MRRGRDSPSPRVVTQHTHAQHVTSAARICRSRLSTHSKVKHTVAGQAPDIRAPPKPAPTVQGKRSPRPSHTRSIGPRNPHQTHAHDPPHPPQWFSTSPSSKVLALAAATVSLILSSWFALFFVGTASLYDTFWTAVAGAGLDWTFSDTVSVQQWEARTCKGEACHDMPGSLTLAGMRCCAASDRGREVQLP